MSGFGLRIFFILFFRKKKNSTCTLLCAVSGLLLSLVIYAIMCIGFSPKDHLPTIFFIVFNSFYVLSSVIYEREAYNFIFYSWQPYRIREAQNEL